MIDEATFKRLSSAVLQQVVDQLEEPYPDWDILHEGDVVNIEDDEGVKYVLNQHTPMRQIWFASPKTGGWHFAYVAGQWQDTKKGTLLAEVLQTAFGISFSLIQDSVE